MDGGVAWRSLSAEICSSWEVCNVSIDISYTVKPAKEGH